MRTTFSGRLFNLGRLALVAGLLPLMSVGMARAQESGLAPAQAANTFDKLRILCLLPKACPLNDSTYDTLKQAVAGEPFSQYVLGASLMNGEGAPSDRVAGQQWIVMAAEAGVPGAARYVENHLQDGDNIDVDETKMATALKALVDKGNVAAMQVLGVMMIRGRGTAQDPDGGWALLLKAAAAKPGGAGEYDIAELLLVGTNGLPKDHAKAMEWYAKAAGKGYIPAMATLGGLWENEPFPDMKELLRTGRLPEQTFKRNVLNSVCWRLRAALMGSSLAQYELALQLSRGSSDTFGHEITPDLLEADYWFRLGARDPEYDNSQVRGGLEPKMTTAQLDQVKKRVAAYRALSFDEMKAASIAAPASIGGNCPPID